jgi:hypothetical protein
MAAQYYSNFPRNPYLPQMPYNCASPAPTQIINPELCQMVRDFDLHEEDLDFQENLGRHLRE